MCPSESLRQIYLISSLGLPLASFILLSVNNEPDEARGHQGSHPNRDLKSHGNKSARVTNETNEAEGTKEASDQRSQEGIEASFRPTEANRP